jgi:MurNAc alpha-1-phosphate uridylyltransferase
MRHIDYGLGVFHRSVFAALDPGVTVDLADVYSILAARGDLAACEVHERFFEIGSFDGIAEFTRLKGS